MSHTLRDLIARQKALQARADAERHEFAQSAESLKKPFSWADRGIEAVQFLKSSPIIWISAFAILSHYKPKLAGKILTFGWGVVKLAKSAKSLV
jgi:hypothetical protein